MKEREVGGIWISEGNGEKDVQVKKDFTKIYFKKLKDHQSHVPVQTGTIFGQKKNLKIFDTIPNLFLIQ